MSRSGSALVLFVAVVLGLSFAVPAEDVPETSYDESESLPLESTPVVSVAEPEAVAEAPAVRPRTSQLRLSSLRRPGAQKLDHARDWAYPICDSLTTLDHPLRC
jgi:hypothetical protein